MQQPQAPTTLPPSPAPSQSPAAGTPSVAAAMSGGGRQKRKLPKPQELVAHYESQGMESGEASLRVIDDLQAALYRVVTSSSSGRGKKEKFMVESSRKLDSLNARLAVLEMKVDSKPGFGETLAIGVASGAALKGIGSVFPHVVGALKQIWTAVQSTRSWHHVRGRY